MTEVLRVSVDNGKYTVCQDEKRGLHVLRYGETWLDSPPGSNAIIALACELEEARAENQRLRRLVGIVLEENLDYPVADSGESVLDLWKHEARRELGIEQPKAETGVRLPARSRR